MASEFSSDALSELRRILLAPEALAETLGPLLVELVRENNAQFAREVKEELASTLRTAVREAVRDELGELSPEVMAKLLSALEPSICNLVRQQFAALLWSNAQTATGQSTVAEATPQSESPSAPLANSETKTASERKTLAPKGCRQLLVFGLTLLIATLSTLWCWNRAVGLEILLSERDTRHSAAASVGDNAQQKPLLVPTDPIYASLESYATTREYDATPTPVIFSASTATLVPPATQTGTSPTESAQPSPTSYPEQTQKLDLVLTPVPSITPTPPLAARENLTASPTEEIIADEVLPNDTPVSAEATKPVDQVLYLTFDDGPSSLWTPQVLAILKQYDAHATFFVIGQEAAKRPELIQAMIDAGHVIAHHTWNHCTLEGIDHTAFVEEIDKTSRLLQGAVSPYLRPPGGVTDANVRTYADELGLEIVQWDIDPSDWKQPTAEEISALVIKRAAPGKIVLLHDGGGDRSQTVAALPTILETLHEQGYVFEPISQR